MSLDHIMIKVKSWPQSMEYYKVALAPLGYVLLKDGGTWGGFHVPGKSSGQIYIKQEENPTRIHFAILAPTEEAVKQYHEKAVSAGGTDNGSPGKRDHYDGIGCFVIDPDNNNIEVCYHA
jgi:catechol 2,3-dioxygenase-like lactoylglutathione lyase family enzyme